MIAFSYWSARIGRRLGCGRRTDRDEICAHGLMERLSVEAANVLYALYTHDEAELGDLITHLIALDYAPEVGLAASLYFVCANDPA